MDIRAVLLVPEEGDLHGLLREGPCGARPPMVWEYQMGQERRWIMPRYADEWEAYATGRRALVLARDGEVVTEGVDAALRAHSRCCIPGEADSDIRRVLKGLPAKAWLLRLGTIVLLDADGREVTDG